MKNSLHVIMPGTAVYVGQEANLPAVICAVKILPGNRVVYSVGWWNAGCYACQELEEFEFSWGAAVKQRIGYR